MQTRLDIEANRQARKYAGSEMVRRILWTAGRVFFRWSPRPCFGWRSFLLRLFGAEVGAHVHIYNTAEIYMPWNLVARDWCAIGEKAFIYNLAPVIIGEKTTISHGAHLCAGTHDYTRPDMPLLKLPITIGNQVWVCADAFVGPSVRIGEGAVIGARAVVVKDVEPWVVMAGNPARVIKKREFRREHENGDN